MSALWKNHAGKFALALGMPLAVSAAYPFLPADWRVTQFLTEVASKRIADHALTKWQEGASRPNRIILVRHAQTHGYSHTCDCKVEGLPVCAQKPEMERPLTEEGKIQALATGVALREIIGQHETVCFVSSPYKACKQTFQYISGSFLESEVSVRTQIELQESKVGPFYYKWPQGESAADVYDRVSSFMETLYRKWAQPDSPQNFVFITHNVVMLCFLMRWFHWDVDTFSPFGQVSGRADCGYGKAARWEIPACEPHQLRLA
ncbi:hypothetical protein BASA81_012716 [Batrachochytrium salamandrivorans]|nr:hypothetical protein BASA81_012716 [Batrachochytrium salamandrivorans]